MKKELETYKNWILSNITPSDKEILRRFRTILYTLHNEKLLRNKDDLDIASYRLLSILKEEINIELYVKGLLLADKAKLRGLEKL